LATNLPPLEIHVAPIERGQDKSFNNMTEGYIWMLGGCRMRLINGIDTSHKPLDASNCHWSDMLISKKPLALDEKSP